MNRVRVIKNLERNNSKNRFKEENKKEYEELKKVEKNHIFSPKNKKENIDSFKDLNLKQYTINIVEQKSFSNFKKIFEIIYYDNSKKTIENLKEYIYELSNYSYCPCILTIYNIDYNSFIGIYISSYTDNNDKLLCESDLPDSFCISVNSKKLCKCSTFFKERFKLSKSNIIKDEMEIKENINLKNDYEKLKNTLKEKENDINELKSKLNKINNELDNKIKENILIQKTKQNLDKKIDEYSNEIKTKTKTIEKTEIENKNNLEKVKKIEIENKNNFEKIMKFDELIYEKEALIKKLEIENNKNKEKINNLNNNILELKSTNNNISNKNFDLNTQLKIERQNVNNLKKKIEDYSNLLKQSNFKEINLEKNLKSINIEKEKLIKNFKSKEENEKKLNEQINELKKKNENDKENLNKNIQNLEKEKIILTMAINKDIGTFEEIHKLGFLKDINPIGTGIQINPKNNQIISNSISNEKNISNEIELKNFYDIILDIKSVKDIDKGWEIKMTEKGEENYIKYKNDELIRIGVIGNSNKGKSFILSRISKIHLPSGTSIKTEGLSIKYPELEKFKDRKIVLLDSAGLETPVLKNAILDETNLKDNITKLNNNDNIEYEHKKVKNENNGKNEEEKNEEEKNDNKNDDKINKELFKEKSREKLITELFLQNYIINNSDILILVVGILTYSEQKLLNRIKTDIHKSKINKPLFIIHNLKTFVTIKQVEDYIENCLLRSATFELKRGHKISTDLKDRKGDYLYEKNSNPKIFHLIFANEGSEAGRFYNEFTLNFIENIYQEVTDLKPFNIIQSVKQRFIDLSKEIIEKIDDKKLLNMEDIISDENALKEKKIKLKNPHKIILKRCLIDELGFSNLKANGFEPNYNYYKKDNKIIIRVEVPGNSNISSKIEYSGEYSIIRLSGIKKQDKEPKLEDNLYNTREFGDFNLDIPLKTEDFNVKNNKPKKEEKKGVIILEYEYESKSEAYDLNTENDEDI